MQKIILIILFFPVIIAAQNDLDGFIKETSVSNTLKHGIWGVYAEYIDTGEPIVEFNSEKSLAPASGLKVFTTSAALSILGEDYTYETNLYFDGTISNEGKLNGNIYIVGDGDPTLGSNLVKNSLNIDQLMESWAAAVKAKGIKAIEGAILADDLIFERNPVPDYWPYIDIGNYYGAGTSGLCINDNLYNLYFKPGTKTGDPAQVLRTEPEIPGLHFTNLMGTGKPGSGDNGYIYAAPLQYNPTLRGTIPAGVSEFSIKGSIPDPPLFAAQHLMKVLVNNGIKISRQASKVDMSSKYDEQKLITHTTSPQLKDIVYIINKRSNNLYTEQLLRTIAFEKTPSSSTESGVGYLLDHLKSNNIPIEGIELYDGCGLSRTNSITAKAMVKLLVFNTKQKYFNSFYNSMGIAGDMSDVSFYKRYGLNSAIAGNARIKSGLINGVRSHSGYLKTRSGRNVAFSFIANNYSGSSSELDKLHIDLMIQLAELNK